MTWGRASTVLITRAAAVVHVDHRSGEGVEGVTTLATTAWTPGSVQSWCEVDRITHGRQAVLGNLVEHSALSQAS